MNAEELGTRLLDEVQEESLSDVCTPFDNQFKSNVHRLST